MIVITIPFAAIGLMSLAYITLLFLDLSRRLNAMTKMKRHYRWFPLAAALILFAALSQIVLSIGNLAPDIAPPFLLQPWFPLLIFHLPLATGVSIALVVVWYYWGWIFREKVG
ncbi:MAG: hypothetical protein N2508_01025 [Anaerolineae bacterium]|nr:hypothetical protein [Anaerolineae bacterium]